MPFFEVPGPQSTGLRLAYDIEGEGPPIVLIHGFASSRATNWRSTSWYRALTEAGRQVIGLDVRGHGESDKPHDPAAYDEGELERDVVRLLDHLRIERADVMGYSMGGFIALRLLAEQPQRLNKLVIAGVGENYYRRTSASGDKIAAGLRAPSSRDVNDAVARQFRVFAEHGKNDLEALALCMLRPRVTITSFPDAGVPVLIVVGSTDSIAGDPKVLGEHVPNAHVVIVPNRDHMLTVGDKAYKEAVIAFLYAHK
ncbi:MAG: alpha/beta fold hydrolase [Alphaproteobacteria bacterium]|nr:alpha/beta fold hydrolase [Alphaproteobacteria bacterium]